MSWWDYIWLYLPLGIIGLWRWSVWALKQLLASFYQPYQSNPQEHNASLAIVIPVYNEDPLVFRKALESWKANNPNELIAVIDKSDKDCIRIFQDFAQSSTWAKLIVTSKPGKRPALADGIRETRSEIVALVDSDTTWSPGVKGKILAPFHEPRIGGVTTRQNVIGPQGTWQKMTDIFWDLRNELDLPLSAKWSRAVTCLSGRTAAYRLEVLLPILDEMVNETFRGTRVISGEDKLLTRLIQKAGWQTWYQGNAQIFSHAPLDFRTFCQQRVRWSRNTWRSDLKSLWEGWPWKRPYLVFHMVDRFISPFTLFAGPIALGTALWLNHWVVALSILLWLLVSRAVKIWFHLKRRPQDFSILPIYVAAVYLVAMIKIYALVTMNKQGWITR